jgi:hypothetical protein
MTIVIINNCLVLWKKRLNVFPSSVLRMMMLLKMFLMISMMIFVVALILVSIRRTILMLLMHFVGY